MKKYRFLFPIIAILLVIIIFTLSIASLYGASDSSHITFINRDGLFSGIDVRLEMYDSDDQYSLTAEVSAGTTASPVFKYGDRYRDHYSYEYRYDRYYRGDAVVMAGYSFDVPEDQQKIATLGGDSYSSSVQYPDGTVETKTYRDPYYEVERVYISRSLYAGEPYLEKRIYTGEPVLLESNKDLKIFVGGGSNSDPYEPAYIELSVNGGNKTRISRVSEGNWYWSDSDGNVWFIDCLEETYFKESSIHHFKKTGEGEDDYEYSKVADITLASNRKIVDYRAYANSSLIVSEDEAGVKHITTCDHRTGELYEICSVDAKSDDRIAIGYSNGVACVRFASSEYYYYDTIDRSNRVLSDIIYRAVDLSSHTLCAYGETEDLVTNSVYGNAYYENSDDIMDILWRDGKLYVIDTSSAHTSGPSDISDIPVISVMDKNGPILMAYRFLSVNYPENGGQNVITKFVK